MDTDTISALNEAHRRHGTWREVAKELSVNHATLCGIAAGKPVSRPLLRRVRRALCLPVAERRKLHRPVASAEDEARRQALGVTWRDVIAAGLDAFEAQEEHGHNHD